MNTWCRTAVFPGLDGRQPLIKFRDGKAVERRYEQSGGYTLKWTEHAAAIGTHPGGAPAKTIDQLYAEAADILRSRSPATNHIYLGFHADGLLSYCTFAEKGCADDCSFGVRIREFRFLK